MWPLRRLYRGAKKLFSRRKPAKKRASARKRRGGRSSAVNRPLIVKKTVPYARLITPCNTNSFGSDTFELTDLPQFATYGALYDKFKILKVKIHYRSLTNSSSIYQAPGQVTTTGIVHSYIDTTDGVAPTTIQEMMNDSTYRSSTGTRDHTRTIYPKFMTAVGAGAQGRSASGWLNTKLVDGVTWNTVSHYSIKYCFEGGSATSAAYTSMIHEPIYTYWFAFKDPK